MLDPAKPEDKNELMDFYTNKFNLKDLSKLKEPQPRPHQQISRQVPSFNLDDLKNINPSVVK